MSKEATSRRYVELHDEPCAIVISRDGGIFRVYRGNEFPYIALAKGDPVPAQSATGRLALDEGAISEWEDADAALWLPSDHGRRLPKLYEQALGQQMGYRLTLLTIDTDAADEADEEEELAESWTARFRK